MGCTFVKRCLSKDEWGRIDFERHGIPSERCPSREFSEWAVDADNDVFFGQLVSPSAWGEMREGIWYYLLLIVGRPIFVRLTGATVRIEGNALAEAQFLNFGAIKEYQIEDLIGIVNLGAICACFDGMPFHFKVDDVLISLFPRSGAGGFLEPC